MLFYCERILYGANILFPYNILFSYIRLFMYKIKNSNTRIVKYEDTKNVYKKTRLVRLRH